MPPTYQPLPPAGIPQDLSYLFNGNFESLDDVQKRQAALEAQKLNNQVVDQALTDRQTKSKDEDAIKQALVAKYGGANSDTPVDPAQALQVISRLGLAQGDPKMVLDAAKIQETKTNVANRLLTPDELTMYGMPDGSTLADARLKLGFKNADTNRDKVDNIDRHLTDNLNYQKLKGQAPGIFSNQQDANGNDIPLDPAQKTQLADTGAAVTTVLRVGDKLKELTADERLPMGDKAIAQQQLIADLLPPVRKLQKTGMKLNEMVKSNDLATIGDDATMSSRIMGILTGQDPVGAVDRFMREVVSQSQDSTVMGGAALDAAKVRSRLGSDTADIFDKYNVFSRGSTSMPNGGASANNPGKTPDEQTYFEQAKQRALSRLRNGQGG